MASGVNDKLHIAAVGLKKSGEEVQATTEELKANKEELSTSIATLEALIRASSSYRALASCT